jgi:methylase of polypeptide subunit release factors
MKKKELYWKDRLELCQHFKIIASDLSKEAIKVAKINATAAGDRRIN